MISKLHTAAALIAVTVLVSCAAKDSNDYVDKSIIPAGSEKTATQPAAPNPTTPAIPAPNTPVIPGANTVSFTPPQGTLVNSVPPVTATTAATTTAPGMNPPHGQPGHICGTPVGSPLPK